MGEIIAKILKMMIMLPFMIGTVISLSSIFMLAASGVRVFLNNTLLMDLFIFIQMWLPFNLNVILSWMMTTVVAYITYRMSVAAMLFMNRFTRS